MKRALLILLAFPLAFAFAQEHSEAKDPEEGLEVWKWVNFAILAGGLGYGIAKKGGPFFASRSQEIRKGIAESEELRKNAEAKAAEVDRRLASVDVEIKNMQASVAAEQASAAERVREETAAELERIKEHAGREIESAGKAGRMELKRYAARLALDLAEQRIRARMTAESQGVLVDEFVRKLDRQA